MPTPMVREQVRSASGVGAFFDVDNTLVPGLAMEVHFYRHLWQQGLVGWDESLRSVGYWLRHLPRVSLQPLRERKLYLAGKFSATIEPVAEAFVSQQVCPRLSGEARAKLEEHRQAGHTLVLITGALDFLVAPLASYLGIDTVLAARPERTPDGAYTGRLLTPFPYGEGKRHLVESLARQRGLDLARSYAYGDSPGDVEALRCVGNPLVVNPIRGMARIARRENWPTVRWT